MHAILCETNMIVDDRLETVLRTVAAGRGAIRTQLRQLVDLVGRTPPAGWTRTHDAALGRIDALKTALGDAPSAALIGTGTLRSPRLVKHFAADGPKMALAAIINAQLSEAEWRALIPELPVQARGFLRHRRDLGSKVEALLARFGITDFALPLPAGYEPLVVDTPAPEAPTTAQPVLPSAPPSLAGEGISAIIKRIEEFRTAREAQAVQGAALAGASEGMGQTRLPFAEEPLPAPPPVAAIDLQLDAAGTIISADAAQAPALVGLKPFATDPDAPASCDPATIRAGRARLPIAGGLIAIEGTGPAAGAWRIDAVPLFAPGTGHFVGHYARLRRPPAALAAGLAAMSSAEPANDDEAGGSVDRLRQLLHELRTPINAIQGYSELIQQQIMGPTPHQYRSLAAGIASDAAHMLAGFEDIERLVGLESGLVNGRIDPAEGTTDLTGMLVRLVGQLEPVLAPREVRLRADLPDAPIHVAVTPFELERSLWRLLSVIASTAAPGERLALTLRTATGPKGEEAQLALPLPATLAMRDDAALMAPDPAGAMPSGGAMLGCGFALRLASAEIRAASGRFTRDGARLDVALPLLTSARQALSHAGGPAEQAG